MLDLIKLYVTLGNYGIMKPDYHDFKEAVNETASYYQPYEAQKARMYAMIINECQSDIHSILCACYDTTELEAQVSETEAQLKRELPSDFVDELLGEAYYW